jgi:hypothetical protein
VKCKKGKLTDAVWRVRDKCTILFPCEWEKEEWDGPPTEIGALDTVYLGWRESTSSWCRRRIIKQIGRRHVESCKGECTNRCERLWQVWEMDEDDGVLGLQERQLRNVPEELGWWYRVNSKTVGRYCNRCACWLPREEWDLCNWKAPVDTEVKVAACINCSERNQSSQRPIRKCTERHSEVLGIRSADPIFADGNAGVHGPLFLDGELLQRYLVPSYPREWGSSLLVGHCGRQTGSPFSRVRDKTTSGRHKIRASVERAPMGFSLSWKRWIGSGAKAGGRQAMITVVNAA